MRTMESILCKLPHIEDRPKIDYPATGDKYAVGVGLLKTGNYFDVWEVSTLKVCYLE